MGGEVEETAKLQGLKGAETVIIIYYMKKCIFKERGDRGRRELGPRSKPPVSLAQMFR